jgi:hypothetical protein
MRFVGAVALGGSIVGCSGPEKPRTRIGSLPFPGPFTLFHAVDPAALGRHSSEDTFFGGGDEEDRGTIYTCRAGFLDICHIRNIIDRTRYYALRLDEALARGDSFLTLPTTGPDKFRVTLEPLPPVASRRDAAIDLALQLAWIDSCWHEIITWYGYKSTVIVPESQSAFTYDDTMSHVVGLAVAGRVLRESADWEFDDAVTRALDDELSRLGAVSVDECMRAIDLVHGEWWRGGTSIKRHVDLGFDDGVIEPWLVPAFAPCGDVAPAVYRLPPVARLARSSTFDERSMSMNDGVATARMDVSITPRLFEWPTIRGLLIDRPTEVLPQRHFPKLMEAIRRDFTSRFGEACADPSIDESG